MLVGRFSGPSPVTSRPAISMVPDDGRRETAHHAQKRGLAAARGTKDRQEVARRDIEIERMNGDRSAIGLADAAQFHKHGLSGLIFGMFGRAGAV